MSRKSYHLGLLAVADLLEIQEYLMAHSTDAADHVADSLTLVFELLAKRPNAGIRRPDLTARPYRFRRAFSYLVVYDPTTVPVTVVRVLHASRDVARLLR